MLQREREALLVRPGVTVSITIVAVASCGDSVERQKDVFGFGIARLYVRSCWKLNVCPPKKKKQFKKSIYYIRIKKKNRYILMSNEVAIFIKNNL